MFTDQDYGYAVFFSGVDTVLIGRKTYDLCLSFDEYPYKGTQGFAFSRRPRMPDQHVTFVSEDLAGFISALKNKPGRNIWLVGGGEIMAEAVKHDLLDELIVSIHPVILGDGVPLFPPGLPERPFRFVRSESFDTGLVQLWYKRTR